MVLKNVSFCAKDSFFPPQNSCNIECLATPNIQFRYLDIEIRNALANMLQEM